MNELPGGQTNTALINISTPRASPRWIALVFAQLPIDAQTRIDCYVGEAMPMAVLHQQRIVLANEAAHQAGVQPGQARGSALAVCPLLALIERDTERERRLLQQAALALLRFAPHVSMVTTPSGLSGIVIEVRASVRLFGGWPVLREAILDTVQALGLRCSSAAFYTATGAWLLARARAGDPNNAAKPLRLATRADALRALDAAPVACLDHALPHLAVLTGIGIDQVGALNQLDRAGVARRFGPALLNELDRAYGLIAEVREPIKPPAEFHAHLELMARVDDAASLLFAAQRLLLQMVGWLTARHAAVSAFTLALDVERSRSTTSTQDDIVITLAQPSADVEHLTVLLRERLAQVALTAPVLEIALHATAIVEAPAPSGQLFPAPVNQQESLLRLIDRLTAKLGADAVQSLEPMQDHRPEQAQRRVRARLRPSARGNQAGSSPSQALADEAVFHPQPSWLIDPPLPLTQRNHRPYYQGVLRLIAGPERIEAGWWSQLATRDYFIAERRDGSLLWIYRERLGEDERWFLQGRFG